MREFRPSLVFEPDDKDRIRLRWESFQYLDKKHVAHLYEERGDVHIHLEECNLLGHDGLLWILSVVRWREAGRLGRTCITLPRDPGTIRFLDDLAFPDHVLASGGLIMNEEVLAQGEEQPRRGTAFGRSRHSPTRIQFVDAATYRNVLGALTDYFDHDVLDLLEGEPASGELQEKSRTFQKAMTELIINVAHHGARDRLSGTGYVCYRPFPRGVPFLRFCCTDMGGGLKYTLEKYNKDLSFASEADAIVHALLYRFYTPEEGVLGFYRTLPFIRDLRGKLMLRSVDASVVLDLSTQQAGEHFDRGYSQPSAQWIKGLVNIREGPLVRGCHVALDLGLPGIRKADRGST